MQKGLQHAALSICLLGTFNVTMYGVPVTTLESDRVRALLSFLAVESDRPHRREYLAALLWPDRPERSARRNLRQALYNLRQAIETSAPQGSLPADGHYLWITSDKAQFDPTSDHWLDVQAFASLSKGCPAHAAREPGHARQGADDCPDCIVRLQQAVDIYREGFLAGLTLADSEAFEKWRMLQEQLFHRQMIESLTRLAIYYERHGDYARAALVLQRQIALEPWHEEAHRQRMRVLAFGGQRSAALAQYNACCQILQQEFGSSPSQATTELCTRIQSGTMALDWIAGSSPYKGLQAFSEADSADFYGRDDFVERLLQVVGRRQVVAVVGPSGSGKSSLVYAGLLPYLRMSGAWAVASLRPGPNPFRQMANALIPLLDDRNLNGHTTLAKDLESGRRSLAEVVSHVQALRPNRAQLGAGTRRRLLIVVDAFEELYTLCLDPARRQAFLDRLLGPASDRSIQPLPYAVLFTLRADFFGQALAYPGMANVLSQGCVILGPMSGEGLRQAIEEPAKARGIVYEPGLVARLLNDVGHEPGNLPLLQFTLTQLWERQHKGQFTHAAYEEIGGVAGALTSYAEDVYARLYPDEQQDARHALTRMVRSGQGTADTRRPVTRDELSEREWRLVHKLADARLVVTGRDASGHEIAEVVHEALIQTWERMRAWLEADLTFHFWLHCLRTAIRQWELCGRDDGALLRGALLNEAEEWATGRAEDLSPGQRAFIAASIALRDREWAKAQAQRERERAQRRALERAVQLSQSLRLATNARLALRDLDTDLALALALEASRCPNLPPGTQRTLAEAAYAPGTRRLYKGHNTFIRCLAISPDRRTALSGAADRTLILWDLLGLQADPEPVDTLDVRRRTGADPTTGQMLHRLCGHQATVYCVAFSPDGGTALSGGGDHALIQWDLETGRPIRRFEGHHKAVFSVAYHPDGHMALSGSCDRSLLLWDLTTGRIVRRFEGLQADIWAVAISPDGRTALSGAEDGGVIFWELAGGNMLHQVAGQVSAGTALASPAGHTACVRGIAFGPAEGTALSVSEDRSVILWDTERGKIQHRFDLFGAGRLYSVDISPDKQWALLGTRDSPSILLNLQSGQIKRASFGHRGRIEAVVFADDRHVLSGAANGDLRLSDLTNGAEVRCLQYDPTRQVATSLDLSPDGRWGATGFRDGSITFWDAALPDVSAAHGPVQAEVCRPSGTATTISGQVRFMPDGRTAISCSSVHADPSQEGRTTLYLWDVETGAERERLEGCCGPLTDLAVCPDGRAVLLASLDGTIRRWELARDVKDTLPATAGTGRNTGSVLVDCSPQEVSRIAIRPDGRAVLVGLGEGISDSPDFGLRLVEGDTGREMRRLVGHNAPIWALAIHPDGRLALSGAIDGTVMLWDLERGTILHRLEGHTGGVLGAAFSPQGPLAVTCSQDERVIVWDISTGQEVRRYLGHRGEVTAVRMAHGGRAVISAGADLTVREWRIDATQEELLAWIRANRYVAEFTPEQRKQYQIELLDVSRSDPSERCLAPQRCQAPGGTEQASPPPGEREHRDQRQQQRRNPAPA